MSNITYKEYYKNKACEMLKDYKADYRQKIWEKYKSFKHVCIFGCGNMGRELPQLLKSCGEKGIIVDCYCDNDKSKVGKDVYNCGIKCISIEDLIKIKNETAVIISTRYYKEIYEQLVKYKFPLIDRVFHNKFYIDDFLKENDREKVINSLKNLFEILEDEESCRVLTRIIEEWTRSEYSYGQLDDIYSIPQYFPVNIMQSSDKECFVDCGAYNGDSISDFLNYSKGKFEKYYAFELNNKNCEELRTNIEMNYEDIKEKFVVENKGVSKETKEVRYEDGCEGSKINQYGMEKGQIVALDDYFSNNQEVTFIKMDIEGAEMDALVGAKKLIEMQQPKLAICLYHKPDDLWKIPLYIKKINKKYNIYIRHHTDLMNETVCYAIINAKNKN